MEATDRPAVRAMQERLSYADPDLVDVAVSGPFSGVVAVEGGRVLGYAIALAGPTTTISELVVRPDARRAGHGRALVDSLSSAETDQIVVTTPVDNDSAIQFYESVGFERDGRTPGFYADGTDALCLTRRE